MVKKKFQIKDIHCSACVLKLEAIEDELAGVKRVTASYRNQIMEVEYDELQLNDDKIMEAVAHKGYQAVCLNKT